MGCKCTESPTNYQRSLCNFRWLHIPLKKKPNTHIAPMAAQIGSTLVKSAQGVYTGSMAVVAGSMAAGVISTMRGSPEKVTSALEVFIPLAQAVGSGGVAAAGKEGLGVVAAAGKEGLGGVAVAVVVSSMILYRGRMRWMDQQAKAQQQAQQALNQEAKAQQQAQLAQLRAQE